MNVSAEDHIILLRLLLSVFSIFYLQYILFYLLHNFVYISEEFIVCEDLTRDSTVC